MALDRDRPEILTPPQHPLACCTQQTITIPAGVLAKTAQKHDYPSAAWRRSYARRSGAERGFATAKDPATSTISRGWCRLTGLAPLMLFTTALLAVRNHRILAAWNARQDENGRRAAKGLPPKTRRRRRKNPAMSAAAPPRQPPSPAPPPRSPAPHGGASIPSHARQKPRTAEKAPTAPWNQPGPGQDHHPARNFRPKRENDPTQT
jgi:hypothetical protein